MNLPQLNEGEVNAGLCIVDGKVSHWLILLPATTDKVLKWQEAIDWAKSVGGELPTRAESALLYANVCDQIDQYYSYWTATAVASEPSCAWRQYFDYGYQYGTRKDGLTRARAVRRVQFTGE